MAEEERARAAIRSIYDQKSWKGLSPSLCHKINYGQKKKNIYIPSDRPFLLFSPTIKRPPPQRSFVLRCYTRAGHIAQLGARETLLFSIPPEREEEEEETRGGTWNGEKLGHSTHTHNYFLFALKQDQRKQGAAYTFFFYFYLFIFSAFCFVLLPRPVCQSRRNA